jgi:cytochrome c oxidase assembly factor CtaG
VDPYAWRVEPEAVVLVPLLAVAYWLALKTHPASRGRIGAFAAGLVLVVAVFVTPLESMALRYLLTAHLLQNVALAEWAPALLVLGIPPSLAAALGRVPAVAVLTRPLVALPLWLVTYFAWHVPWAYDFALRHPASVLHLEHLCYLVSGAALWWPVVHETPHRLASAGKAAYLFAAFLLGSPLGLLLALLPTPVYGFYRHGPVLWGWSHLFDQQIGGATMASEQALVFFAVFSAVFLRFLREEEARGQLYEASWRQPDSSTSRASATPASQTRRQSPSGRS